MAALLKYWREAATLILVTCKQSKKNVQCQPSISSVKEITTKKNACRLMENELGLDVMLLKRSSKSSFMPSVYVFPGGVASDADFSDDWRSFFMSVNSNLALNTFKYVQKPGGGPPMFNRERHPQFSSVPSELAFRICAIRETFEESGVLLARRIADLKGITVDFMAKSPILGAPIQIEKDWPIDLLEYWRKEIYANPSNFLDMCQELRIIPDVWCLYEWSNWLTPTGLESFAKKPSHRFDTAFYIVCVVEKPAAMHDEGETVHLQTLEDLGLLQSGGSPKDENTLPVAVAVGFEDTDHNRTGATQTSSKAVQATNKPYMRTRRLQFRGQTKDKAVQVNTVPDNVKILRSHAEDSDEEMQSEKGNTESQEDDLDDLDYSPSETASDSESGSDYEEETEELPFPSCSDPIKERQIIVSENCLMELLSVCRTCCKQTQVCQKRKAGTLLVLEAVCEEGHRFSWNSQQMHRGLPLGNLNIAAATLFSGSSASKVKTFLDHLNTPTISKRTYHMIQKHYLVPTVSEVWHQEQDKILDSRIGKPLVIGGDGRCNSPGFSAKYGSYNIMDLETKTILHTELVQWGSPKDVLYEYAKNQVQIAPPQIYELSRLSHFSDIHQLNEFVWKRESHGILRYFPIQIKCQDAYLFVLPGDDLYPKEPNEETGNQIDEREETLAELNKKFPKQNRTYLSDHLCVSCNIDMYGGHVRPLSEIVHIVDNSFEHINSNL